MLVGATALLGWHWPLMGLVVGLGSVMYIAFTALLSLRYVAPAARLGNAWDTRMGGALADAVTCNAVVKAFGAERRARLRAWSTVAPPHPPHLDARHAERRRAGRHAGADAGRHDRRIAVAVGARPGQRGRHHLR